MYNEISLLYYDTNRIHEAKKVCESPKYFLVNQETLELIKKKMPYEIYQVMINDNVVNRIQDLNIAICENLNFGEFEVR